MIRNIWIEPPAFGVRRGAAMLRSRQGLRSLRDRGVCARGVRGYHSAQPPANGWHPFGMAATAQAGGLTAISRGLRSIATTPPVAGRKMTRTPVGYQRMATFAARADGHLGRMRFAALIPTGLWPKAQGCEERATLGQPSVMVFNPNGVASSGGGRWATTPLGLFRVAADVPKVARASQPWAGGHNPFGIDRMDGHIKKMGAAWK